MAKCQTGEKLFGHLRLKFEIYLAFVIWYLEFQPYRVPAMSGEVNSIYYFNFKVEIPPIPLSIPFPQAL